jgi:hypothetical protein
LPINVKTSFIIKYQKAETDLGGRQSGPVIQSGSSHGLIMHEMGIRGEKEIDRKTPDEIALLSRAVRSILAQVAEIDRGCTADRLRNCKLLKKS